MGGDPNDASGKVAYDYEGSLSELDRKNAPVDLKVHGCVFGATKLSFDTVIELPDLESSVYSAVTLTEKEREKYWKLHVVLINKILGHSNNIQGNMELECELISHGIYCGNPSGYAKECSKDPDKNVDRWNLLLQLDSKEILGMMWGDCGRLYLWITDENPAARRFDAAWLILQCR